MNKEEFEAKTNTKVTDKDWNVIHDVFGDKALPLKEDYLYTLFLHHGMKAMRDIDYLQMEARENKREMDNAYDRVDELEKAICKSIKCLEEAI